MTEIVLSACRLSWTAAVQHGSRWDQMPVMQKIRPKILARDNHTCQGCQWRAKDFQEIHHRNGDHSNFKEANLEVLCPLCHQVFHPAQASISNGASMIWLPELSQVELNRLLIAIFAISKMGATHPLQGVSKAIWGLLEMRKVYLENQLGKSDPGIFGQMLLNLPKDEYAQRGQKLSAVKMLANPLRFETESDYWAATFEKTDFSATALQRQLDALKAA